LTIRPAPRAAIRRPAERASHTGPSSINRVLAAPGVGRELLQLLGQEHARDVDERGQRAELRLDAFEHLVMLGDVGDVQGAGQDPAGGLDRLDVGRGDREPVVTQAQGHGAADAVRRPRHQGRPRARHHGRRRPGFHA